MFALVRDGRVRLRYDETLKYNEGSSMIIDYGDLRFSQLSGIMSVVNEFYYRINKMGKDKEILEVVHEIVEKLTNLQHFHINLDSNRKDDTELVEKFMEKFANFEYKTLEEPIHEEYIQMVNAKNVSESEFDSISKQYLYGDRFTKGTPTHCCIVHDNDGERCTIHFNVPDTRVISIANVFDDENIVRELKAVINEVYTMTRSTHKMKDQVFFKMRETGFHEEIQVLINNLLDTLVYLMNIQSFNDNKFYDFDKMEINRRMRIDFMNFIKRAEQVAKYQIKTKEEN